MRFLPSPSRLKTWSWILLFSCLQAPGAARAAVSVLTQHNDNNRSGANLLETALTTANVNQGQFGKLFTDAVDDQIYTQPLYVPGVAIAGGTHNVVYVATMSDSVYAFDADAPGAPLWHDSFTNPPSVVPVNHTQVGGNCGNYQDISGNIGILGTPVINGNVIYLVARTFENGTTFVQKLHALDIRSGAEMANSPVVIQATAPGTGTGSVNGTLTFDPQIQNQRAALGFFNNTVYIFYSSHCDTGNYHGWMFGYNGTSLQQTLVSDTTPNGGDGSIWESGQGPAIDASGNFYFMTGNGVFDVSSGGSDLGDSFVKLNSSLSLQDWFTPFNQATLDGSDADLGCGGLLLIPGTSLVTGGGKEGRLYLVNGTNMGHFNASADQITQE
ncbi:MAG TPA: pyrrolo-quinoline quinone, partial [bacterium]|nr:pyrrolo-quinoline quinone [bacterium]